MEIPQFFDRWLTIAKGTIENLSEDEIIVVGLVGIVIYIGWLIILFSWFRPRLARWLSRKAQDHHSRQPGKWQLGD